MEWKKNHNNDYYIEHFQSEVLDRLDAIDVILDFSRLAPSYNIEKMILHLFVMRNHQIFVIGIWWLSG